MEYVGQTSPDPLVIDYDLIRTAPPELNIAGVGDLLSIHTALFRLGTRRCAPAVASSRSAPEDVAAARAILADTMAKADAIRSCSDDGLRAIVEGYMRVNTICLPAGHYRVEEGSEHYLFYELEERLKRPFIHGWIVGLGVHLLSRLQENRTKKPWPSWTTSACAINRPTWKLGGRIWSAHWQISDNTSRLVPTSGTRSSMNATSRLPGLTRRSRH